MIRSCLLACLLVFTVLASGCVAVVAGAAAAGTIQYVRNGASREYPATLEATWTATLASLRDLGYPVDPSASYGASGGTLEVDDVDVHVDSAGRAATRVRVRVGTFDTDAHRDRTAVILNGITGHLGG